jgi:bifunctional DNA-binding transcriptional regulator/antitoxin component of YhaV-PrlF toxin-antitoxin module
MNQPTHPLEVPVVIGTIRIIDDNGRVTFPKEVLAEAGLAKGDAVTVFAYRGSVTVTKREEA